MGKRISFCRSLLRRPVLGPDGMGLIKLHGPKEQLHQMEIILLHGLGGTSHSTWTWHDGEHYFWPTLFKDDPELQLARVWTYGYDAAISARFVEKSIVDVPDFALELLRALKAVNEGLNVRGLQPPR